MSATPTLAQARAAARTLLARLSILAEASASSLEPSKRGTPGHAVLAGSIHPRDRTHDYWRQAFLAAWHDAPALHRAVRSATRDLEAFTTAPKAGDRPEETRAQLDRRIVRDGTGYSIAEAAVHFRTTHKVVIAARTAAERDPSDGSEQQEIRDKAAKAREMARAGMTRRAIGRFLGAHHEQVKRWIEKDA